MIMSHDIYLASQSPRRRELLSQIGVRYKTLTVDVEERQKVGEAPAEYVARLAKEKSMAGVEYVKATGQIHAPVLGADTIVVLEQQVLEKPANQQAAVDMLLSLSGKTHRVMTAVAICSEDRCEQCVNVTEVSFRDIHRAEAERYWLTGESNDKAGAYGIQGLAGVFVTSLQGSYSSVVGLPLQETSQLLAAYSVPIWNRL